MPRRETDSCARPLVWGLLGERAGDNRQVEQLVAALGYRSELKRMAYSRLRHLPNYLLGTSSASLRRSRSSPLEPPWPDLVVSAGRRSVPVARWIRKRSGGCARLVQLGRPRAALGSFDLVVTTPQYGLPAGVSVVANTLPFQTAATPEPAILEAWREEFSALPRPWIGVLVGGEVWPLRFAEATAAALGRAASAAAVARGGSLLVATSPRTGSTQTDALFGALRGSAFRADWQADRPGCYASILALADAFIVTADSVSMLAEACRSEKPVEIYPLERRGGPWVWLANHWRAGAPGTGAVTAVATALARSGILTPPRDVRRVAEALIERGAARPFAAEASPTPANADLLRREMEDTVSRIRALVGQDAPG